MSGRRRGKPDDATPGIVPAYEGPEVLEALLRKAGSPSGADDVIATFQRAQAAGEPRSAVIPALFPDEPRFATPEDARRLYSNLFGLWARLAAGLGAHDDAPEVVPEASEPPPLPERGAISGSIVPADLVEAIWKNLAAAPPREVQRQRDRFTNVQPDLAAWLDVVALPDSGALATQDLAFEAWAMFDHAFGERLGGVEWRTLTTLEKEPPPLEETQPPLAAYAAEQLDVLEGEDPAFGEAERAQVERAIATVGAALTEAVREPS
ncbi:hypothetical protein [Anaeromyxobacter oryzae]|uniref:Uncharacterized protein n=1 Tax=Anaeromyxobacter oryzae TaxID=2918170 RepID=A0ABN6MP22_9BACT|nr:hypothetical protein [Anaeromyxobacter oryzae]BDG02792.1 hypothetical protein AMOR_17880 [Anaeromyxobacter oryzae]